MDVVAAADERYVYIDLYNTTIDRCENLHYRAYIQTEVATSVG